MAYIGLEIESAMCKFRGAKLHLTLAHFNKPTKYLGIELADRLMEITNQNYAPELEFQELARWDIGAVYVVKKTNSLMVLRNQCLRRVESLIGEAVSTDYEYTPHITLVEERNDWHVYPPRVVGLELAGLAGIVRYSFPFAQKIDCTI